MHIIDYIQKLYPSMFLMSYVDGGFTLSCEKDAQTTFNNVMVNPCLLFNASTLLLNDQENPLQGLALGKIAFNGRC